MIAHLLWPASLPLDLAALAVAVSLDLALPELPSFLHPVRWMGAAIGAATRRSPPAGAAPQFLAGVAIALLVPGLFALSAGLAGAGLMAAGAILYVVIGGVLLKSTFAVRGLTQAGRATAELLAKGDLSGARLSLQALVSRDRSSLTSGQAAGAAIESVAENSTDSYIAPWLCFALFGLAGAFAYRAINTLDSMIGYHGRYEYLGKASARLDDLVNLVPARVSAFAMLCAGAMAGLPFDRGLRVMLREHGRTASPNAGCTMSAMAGLLRVRLEKTGHYVLGGEFPEPSPQDIGRATRVVGVLAVLGLAISVALLYARHALVGA